MGNGGIAMSMTSLSLKSLKDLEDGKVDIAFNQYLDRCVKDCMDRPLEGKPREINMKVSIVPDTDKETRECDRVNVQVTISDTIPKRHTRAINMAVHRNGRIVFNKDSLDNVDQGTLLPDEVESEDD